MLRIWSCLHCLRRENVDNAERSAAELEKKLKKKVKGLHFTLVCDHTQFLHSHLNL